MNRQLMPDWIWRLRYKIPRNKEYRVNRRNFYALGFAFLAVLLAALLYLPAGSARTAERAPTEYEVKAAYIFYFAKFVNWPDDAFPDKSAPVSIGVFGDDEFGSLLQSIVKDKTIQAHPISIRALKWPVDPRACHMIYISASELKRAKQITENLQQHSVLTVTEADAGSPARGIMNLFVEGGKVQFEVDMAAAERAHLQISSKLLRMTKGSTANYKARD
jgi:hypothetical protein